MSGRSAVTILHLSDLQFGRNHRFGRLGLPPPDDQFDTLFARLADDLEHLRRKHRVVPNLLVVTGDIVEWGKAKEFDDALLFLEKLIALLALPRRRMAVVPGNHDINRKSCEAYFNKCEADDVIPVPPYWLKWEHYNAFFQKLYRGEDGITFTPDEPWSTFSIPELKVVVAGLNSTMAESHLEGSHHGHVGEMQLRWFAERLEPFRKQEWLRLGAVHHNIQRGCKDDNENLYDADDLARLLGPSLNLCLHGHTHQGRIGWLNPRLPILSTGSTAVDVKARPEEVPNQYQVIRVSAGTIERWTRCFDPQRRQWIADPRGSEHGDDWITEHPIDFEDVGGIFPKSGKRIARRKSTGEREPGSPRFSTDRGRSDDFLARVEEVCKHRSPDASVTAVRHGDSRLHYLRVAEPSAAFVRQYPIGVFEHGLTAADLERFVNVVDAPYRASDSGLISEIVYGGELTGDEVSREAERRRIRISSFVEYQGIIDFRGYIQRQTGRLDRDDIYPPSLYVPQRMRHAGGMDEGQVEDAVAQVQQWVASPDPRFILILGDSGTGKTFLLHELARRLGRDGTGLIPVLVELRALEKARTLDTLIVQHLASAGMERIDLAAFRYMLQQGRIVLLFDGFDELELRVSYDRAAEHFDTIVQAATGDAKVVVTSRTQHFESDQQVRTIVYERAQPVVGLRYCKLLAFGESQIKQFLLNRWTDPSEAAEWLDLLHDVKDLLGLSENPRMLGFITELNKEELRKTKMKAGVISAAELYRLLLERWLVLEYERAHPPGVQVTLPRDARWAAVTAIAHRLWLKTENFLTQSELVEETSAAVRSVLSMLPETGIAAHLIGSGSLLRRDDDGGFFLVHQSVMEWLVAQQAAIALRETGSALALSTRAMSQLMIDFFCDLAGTDTARQWAGKVLDQDSTEAGVVINNALDVLKRLGGTAAVPNLAGQDVRGQDFAELRLQDADLRGTEFSEARLAGKDLTGARLDGARLVRADLTNAILRNASLQNADLSEARMLGADLRGAKLAGSVWRRTRLVGARVDVDALAGVETYGSAPPDAAAFHAVTSFASRCLSLAWSSDGNLLATGHNDHLIRLWEADSGRELRQFAGHQASVRSIAFSADGMWLASGSDDRTIRLWEAATGREICQLVGHQGNVRCVVFNIDATRVASGGDDGTVRIWDPAEGRMLRLLSGHRKYVWSVAFSPDGTSLASGSDDKTVRLWNVAGGVEIRSLIGHAEYVRAVAFSPDGYLLASGGGDRTVRLWDITSGRELRQFTGHRASVASVTFSSDGTRLATAASDHTVRIWRIASGQELRQLGGHQARVRSVAFSPDGRWLASGSDDRTARLWNVDSGQELRQLSGRLSSAMSVAFSPDGKWVAGGSDDNVVRLWNAVTGEEVLQFVGHEAPVLSVAFSPDGRWLATGSDDRTMRLWAVAGGVEARRFVGHKNSVWSVAFSPNGKRLASGSDDRTIRVWDRSDGEALHLFSGLHDVVRSLAFSSGGKWLAAGCGDAVRLWSASTHRSARQLDGHESWIRSIAFSPDEKWLASGSSDRTVRLWDAVTGGLVRQFEGHAGAVRTVAFSPGGNRIASGGADRTVRLWDAVSGNELRRFVGHQDLVWSLAFSPDGKLLASGSRDSTIRLWDVDTGTLRVTLLLLTEGWAAFAPDGRYKYLGNPGGSFWFAMNLCRFEPGELDPYIPAIRRMDSYEPF